MEAKYPCEMQHLSHGIEVAVKRRHSLSTDIMQHAVHKLVQQQDTDMPGFAATGTKLPNSVQSAMANDIIFMRATNIRPYSIVDGARIKKVAQKLIALGQQYGNVIADILPCTTTVSYHLNTAVATRKVDITEKLLMAENLGITIDGWTHTTTNHQYITLRAHYNDNEGNL